MGLGKQANYYSYFAQEMRGAVEIYILDRYLLYSRRKTPNVDVVRIYSYMTEWLRNCYYLHSQECIASDD